MNFVASLSISFEETVSSFDLIEQTSLIKLGIQSVHTGICIFIRYSIIIGKIDARQTDQNMFIYPFIHAHYVKKQGTTDFFRYL